ncbi:hypothetical protein [Cysteiniphilum litorale]|uniref:hypothetical protein n=1 Tax=Cysteiniphilum litorale TaxID=2056700 RepID=UPI003F881834
MFTPSANALNHNRYSYSHNNKNAYSEYVLSESSSSRCVNINEINQLCTHHFGDQALLAKQKLLSGESVLILGKGYLRLQRIEQDAVLF